MFPNSKQLRCSQHIQNISPASPLVKTNIIPNNISRKTNNSFLFCDTRDSTTTNIIECSFNQNYQMEQQTVEQFMGQYEYSCFGDDHTFLANKEGDIIYYDNITKNTVFVEKQHPSMFHTLQIHNIDEIFITCGGNVKNQFNQHERIIKIWKAVGQEELEMKGRIVTGHSKPIDNSFVLARNRLITLSTDQTLRNTNLSTLQVQSIIPTSMNYYSGCQLDWSSILLGGIGQSLSIFDVRGRKLIRSTKLQFYPTQITKIFRINSSSFLLCDINKIYMFDIRMMKGQKKGEYDGERISQIQSLGQDLLYIGNYDNSFQIWKCT